MYKPTEGPIRIRFGRTRTGFRLHAMLGLDERCVVVCRLDVSSQSDRRNRMERLMGAIFDAGWTLSHQ